MGTHASLPRAAARVLVACVVLAGLFLMHGLPTGNCGGQGGGSGSSMTSAVVADPTMNLMPVLVETGVAAQTARAVRTPSVPSSFMTGPRAAAVSPPDVMPTSTGTAGAMCVSRPPPSGLASLLALSLLVAVGEAVGLGGLTGRLPRRPSLRGPPRAGAVLLLRLCISRT